MRPIQGSDTDKGEAAMVQGSCLCGAITFEVDPSGAVLTVACFCSNCRKVSGSQFGVYLQVKPSAFWWLTGEEDVASFESSPGNRRGFCRTCGCVAPIATSYGAMRVPAGALEHTQGLNIDAVIYASGKVDWCAPETARQSFPDAGPPDFWRKAIVQLFAR